MKAKIMDKWIMNFDDERIERAENKKEGEKPYLAFLRTRKDYITGLSGLFERKYSYTITKNTHHAHAGYFLIEPLKEKSGGIDIEKVEDLDGFKIIEEGGQND